MKMKTTSLLLLGAALVAPGLAFASGGTTIDVSAAVTAIGAIGAAVASVGVAKFAPAAIAVAYKWAKAAIFG